MASRPHVPSPSLAERAKRFEHDALAEVFEASVEDAYEYVHALTGDDATAERALNAGYQRLLAQVGSCPGEAGALTPWVLAQVEEAVRRTPHAQPDGLRGSLGRLGHHEHQALTLRLVAGLEPTVIAAATGRRVSSVLASTMSALRSLAGLGGVTLPLPAAQRQLDAALDHVLQGMPATEAAGWAPAVTDGHRLLAIAQEVVQLPRLGSGPTLRGRVRSAFLAAADERRTLWVREHYTAPVVPGRRPRAKPRTVGTAAALGFACLLALAAGVFVAAAAAFSSPSSSAYPLKRFGESVLAGVTTDRVAKANFQVKLSEERLKEAETEAAVGHGTATARAVDDRYEALRVAAADLAALHHRDARWIAARDRFEAEANKSVDPIQRALDAQKEASAAASVKRTYQRFQADRQELDRELGVKAAPAPVNPGTPGSVPTPAAVQAAGG